MIKHPRVTMFERAICLHYTPLLSVMNKMLSVKYTTPLFSQLAKKMGSWNSQKLVSLAFSKDFWKAYISCHLGIIQPWLVSLYPTCSLHELS